MIMHASTWYNAFLNLFDVHKFDHAHLHTHPLVTPPIQQRLDQTVSSLRRAAEQPKTCVVSDFDEMLEPLAEKCRVGSREFVKALATFHDDG